MSRNARWIVAALIMLAIGLVWYTKVGAEPLATHSPDFCASSDFKLKTGDDDGDGYVDSLYAEVKFKEVSGAFGKIQKVEYQLQWWDEDEGDIDYKLVVKRDIKSATYSSRQRLPTAHPGHTVVWLVGAPGYSKPYAKTTDGTQCNTEVDTHEYSW